MDLFFWQRLHGGSTHFPIVLLLASVIFDFVAWRSRDDGLRRGLQLAGLSSAIVGALGGVGAVISGLVMTRGEMLGSGYEKFHHLFIWPAFTSCCLFVGWRLMNRGQVPQRARRLYLAWMTLASGLMMGAGYWGGEMLLGAQTRTAATAFKASATNDTALATRGHKLFLLNCAHCHGDEGRGDGPDEGANLHNLDKSNARIASIIHNGVKGEMPKFGSKFSDPEVQALTAYIRSLH
jgi:mono/diheme cytochrome c family protein